MYPEVVVTTFTVVVVNLLCLEYCTVLGMNPWCVYLASCLTASYPAASDTFNISHPEILSVHPSLTGWSGVDSEAAVDAISGICDSYIVSPHLIRAIGGHSSETGEVLHYYCDSLTMYRPNVEAFISQGDILLCLIND
ncbi:hypothetical protein FOXYSP1_00870 [Fusarium oxysporum f. sp. phaseoli]